MWLHLKVPKVLLLHVYIVICHMYPIYNNVLLCITFIAYTIYFIVHTCIFAICIFVTVPPMTAPILTKPIDLTSSLLFTITWTIANPSDTLSYIITWTNLRTDIVNTTVLENTGSYEVTGLNGVDNYNVSVTAKNPCGVIESDPVTVYGKNIATMCLKLSIINLLRTVR